MGIGPGVGPPPVSPTSPFPGPRCPPWLRPQVHEAASLTRSLQAAGEAAEAQQVQLACMREQLASAEADANARVRRSPGRQGLGRGRALHGCM